MASEPFGNGIRILWKGSQDHLEMDENFLELEQGGNVNHGTDKQSDADFMQWHLDYYFHLEVTFAVYLVCTLIFFSHKKSTLK